MDFGDHQIFEGVTTYPAILTMQAGAPGVGHELQFWKIGEMPEGSFADAFADAANAFPQAALGRGSWELEGDTLRALRAKITTGKQTLKQVYGSPLYGIKTGLNEAFVIDSPTKEQLCRDDPRSAELLKPFLEGKDLKRWRSEPRGLWIIYIPKNRIKIDDYPAIRDWLSTFKAALEKRATAQEWFELQQAQDSCTSHYEGRKIVYGEFSGENLFSLDSGHFINNKCYFIPSVDPFLLGLLNSKIFWFCIIAESVAVRGRFFQMQSQFVERTPVPSASDVQRTEIGASAIAAQTAAEKRYALQQSITRRIPDLAADPVNAKLTGRLKEWWTLPDFAAFQKEVEKALKAKIPLQERNEWESWINTNRAEIHALTAEIRRAEAEINTKVYALFDLTVDEIALLEANI